MTREDIIKIANKVYGDYEWSEQMIDRLSQFAGLVAEHEREWVGLTDDEYEQFSQWTHIEIIERIVAKLKEKNT